MADDADLVQSGIRLTRGTRADVKAAAERQDITFEAFIELALRNELARVAAGRDANRDSTDLGENPVANGSITVNNERSSTEEVTNAVQAVPPGALRIVIHKVVEAIGNLTAALEVARHSGAGAGAPYQPSPDLAYERKSPRSLKKFNSIEGVGDEIPRKPENPRGKRKPPNDPTKRAG